MGQLMRGRMEIRAVEKVVRDCIKVAAKDD